jgi:cytochrome c-type biogenesis protein CcmH
MALFYGVAGALALVTVLVLIRPLFSGRAVAEARGVRDTRLYRDQLDEVERDLVRGTIRAGEAEGARAEVSRRLIAAAGRAEAAVAHGPAPRLYSRLLAGIALIGAPALALALYLANGMPGQPDLPLADRSTDETAQMARPSQAEAETTFTPDPMPPLTGEQQEYVTLIIRLEKILEKRPDDAKGLELLANGYLRLGRYGESWRAFDRLTTVLGDQAKAGQFATKAEAMVLAAGGYVSPAAERAIGEALARDETLPVARYYAGLMMVQNGRLDEAIFLWEQLKTETPPDAPWLRFLDGMLAEAKAMREGGRAGGRAEGRNATPGPSATDIEAAGAMTPGERQEMIAGMVAQLEARLTTEGGEVEEWLRLMNAYKQLGKPDDAARIARLGIAEFNGSTEAGFLREQALVMGLFDQ